MIRSYFGISHNPFVIDDHAPLLEHQQRHFDILKVHSQQGGLCLILGEPGTGKTVLKNAIIRHDPKQWITPVINRSLHTWPNLFGVGPLVLMLIDCSDWVSDDGIWWDWCKRGP